LPLNIFEKTGYTFAGWALSENAEAAEYADGANFTANAGNNLLALYALWTENPFTIISFNSNGAGGTMQNLKIYENASASLPLNIFEKTGYAFAGWAESANGTVTCSDGQNYTAGAGQSEVTLYAIWTAKTFVISFNANGGSGGPAANAAAIYDQPMPVVSGIPVQEGYIFNGYWDAQSGGTRYYNADLSSAKTWDKDTASAYTLYARWVVAA
jgi:uncharacterized repeat protein (TIGR02543 family)